MSTIDIENQCMCTPDQACASASTCCLELCCKALYSCVVDTGSEKMVLFQIVPLRSSASMAWMWSTEVMPGRSNVYLFYNNLEYSGIMQRVLHVF